MFDMFDVLDSEREGEANPARERRETFHSEEGGTSEVIL